MAPVEVERALRDATASVESHGFGPRAATIPYLRRALGDRISHREFDQELLRLRQEATVELAAHGHPELLGVAEAQEALPEGESVLYILRWLK